MLDKNQWIIQGKKYTACSNHLAAEPGLTLAGGSEFETARPEYYCDGGGLQNPVAANGSRKYLESWILASGFAEVVRGRAASKFDGAVEVPRGAPCPRCGYHRALRCWSLPAPFCWSSVRRRLPAALRHLSLPAPVGVSLGTTGGGEGPGSAGAAPSLQAPLPWRAPCSEAVSPRCRQVLKALCWPVGKLHCIIAFVS